MIITTHTIGTGKKRRNVYAISTTPAENGGSRPEEVRRFDTLEQAALALRFMSGAEMTEAEHSAALEAMSDKKEAATT